MTKNFQLPKKLENREILPKVIKITKSGHTAAVIGCLGGGMKRLKDDIRELFNNEKDLHWISREMQKTVLWESETIMRKILSGLLT